MMKLKVLILMDTVLKALEAVWQKIDNDKVFILGCRCRKNGCNVAKAKQSIWLADIDEDKILKLKDEILSLDQL